MTDMKHLSESQRMQQWLKSSISNTFKESFTAYLNQVDTLKALAEYQRFIARVQQQIDQQAYTRQLFKREQPHLMGFEKDRLLELKQQLDALTEQVQALMADMMQAIEQMRHDLRQLDAFISQVNRAQHRQDTAIQTLFKTFEENLGARFQDTVERWGYDEAVAYQANDNALQAYPGLQQLLQVARTDFPDQVTNILHFLTTLNDGTNLQRLEHALQSLLTQTGDSWLTALQQAQQERRQIAQDQHQQFEQTHGHSVQDLQQIVYHKMHDINTVQQQLQQLALHPSGLSHHTGQLNRGMFDFLEKVKPMYQELLAPKVTSTLEQKT